MRDDDLCSMPATEALARFRDRSLSPVEPAAVIARAEAIAETNSELWGKDAGSPVTAKAQKLKRFGLFSGPDQVEILFAHFRQGTPGS